MKKTIIFLSIIIVSLTACNTAQQDSGYQEFIEKIENNLLPKILLEGKDSAGFNILDRMEHYNVPGVSIAFMDNGEIQWARGYGYSDAEAQLKVDKNTLFQAASISKPVAATAALAMVEQGKLGLDDDVNRYLDGWQVDENEFTAEEKVTLRRILSHSAGLTVHGFGGYSRTDTIPEIIDVLNGKGTANSGRIYPDIKPGTVYRYSGGGYTVMQKMLCDISGKDFPDLMDELVLSKIGMTSSTYQQPLPEEKQMIAATAYRGNGSPVEGKWHIYPEMAAAGLWTTPGDLLMYASEVYKSYHGKSNLILSTDMVRQMLTPQINGHGLGPAISGEGDYLVFSHGGANEGFRCSLFVFAETGQGVAIMTNSDNGGSLSTEILRSFSKVLNWPDNRYKPLTLKVLDMTMDDLMEYEGKYLLKMGNDELIITLSAEDGYIHGVQSWDDFRFKIYPDGEDHFFGLHDGVPFEFARDDKGAIMHVNIYEGSNTYKFIRVN